MKVEYAFTIKLAEENLTIYVSGDSVRFVEHAEPSIIRPKHIRLVADLQERMKEYIRS